MIDITERFLGCEIGQAEGTNCLILRELAFPCEVFDKGKKVKCSHQLEYRWLSCDIEAYSDAEVCVLGNEYIYVTKKEYKELKKKLEAGETLFNCFNLF
jgi:hypothetical protein